MDPRGEGPSADFSFVLVVTSSAINRIVISHIIERIGLKVVACEAAAATDLLRRKAPGAVVVEEDASEEGRTALRMIGEIRQRSAIGLPYIVVLSRPGSAAVDVSAGHGADAVVAMPITSDRLAPVVRRLVEDARRLSSR